MSNPFLAMCFTQIKLVTLFCCPDLTKCLSSFDVMDLFRPMSYHHQACVSTYIQPTPYRTSQFDILIKANKIWIYTNFPKMILQGSNKFMLRIAFWSAINRIQLNAKKIMQTMKFQPEVMNMKSLINNVSTSACDLIL